MSDGPVTNGIISYPSLLSRCNAIWWTIKDFPVPELPVTTRQLFECRDDSVYLAALVSTNNASSFFHSSRYWSC